MSVRLPPVRALHRWTSTALFADSALAFAFSAFLALQMVRHTMWRDELNAWGIVLASPSLPELFEHLHYEGHPGLWHLLLWLAARFTTAPQAMQAVQALIGCGVIWMVAVASPFNRMQKVLLLLSYFILFEYTVVSRNYGMGVLLALVYAHRRALWPGQAKRNAALLGLLANTNLFALILSGALAFEYAWTLFRQTPGDIRLRLSRLLGPAVLYAVLVGISVATFWPAKDISWRTTGEPLAGGLTLDRIVGILANNLSALLPIDQQSFWAPAQMIDPQASALSQTIVVAALPALIFLLVRMFAAMPRLLVIPALTLLGSMAFNLVFYAGAVRHWGINFVAVLAALWILQASTGRQSAWSLPLLGLNAIAGVLFTVQHWAVPFSNAGATAVWLESHGLERASIVGTPDTHLAAVAEMLGRSVYFLDCRCRDTYLAFNKRRDDFSKADIVSRLAEAPRPAAGRKLLYLNVETPSAAQTDALAARGLTLEELAFISGALTENFHIFAVHRIGEAGSTQDGRRMPSAAEPSG